MFGVGGKKSWISLFVLRIYPSECFCFVSFLAELYGLWIMLSRAHLTSFMTSKSSLTVENMGRDLISRLDFSFRACILRAWLSREYNPAYDLWAALREQDGTTKFAGIFGLDWNVCCADFHYQQDTLYLCVRRTGTIYKFPSPTNTKLRNWYDDICNKTGIRCADFDLGAQRSFSTLTFLRLLFLMDIYFYGFPTLLLVATFLENDYDSITSTCEPGLSMEYFLFGNFWIWDGIAGVSVGVHGHGNGNLGESGRRKDM